MGPVRQSPEIKELSVGNQPSKTWPLEVSSLISSKKWLAIHGLRKNKLDMHSILPQIGFKHSDSYDESLRRPVASRYGTGLFQKYFRKDGKVFNISCGKNELNQLDFQLNQAIHLYKIRLDWLSSESRRIFGVIEEQVVTIIVDLEEKSSQELNQYKTALERVIREQISQISRFNLIASEDDLNLFRNECVAVNEENLEHAIKWLWSLDVPIGKSKTATAEAVLKLRNMGQMEAIYLFTQSCACDGAKELLKEMVLASKIPVHVVSFKCSDADMVVFLKDICDCSDTRFHAYGVIMEIDHFEKSSENVNKHVLKRRGYGGVPVRAGVRPAVVELFEEIENARFTLKEIQNIKSVVEESRQDDQDIKNADLLQSVTTLDLNFENTSDSPLFTSSIEKTPPPVETPVNNQSELYMSSSAWLKKHGLRQKKLGLHDVLSNAVFKHKDGVVDLKISPSLKDNQTDAITQQKLVNARYCEKFPVVRWKGGQVVHVQVTPEMYRAYAARMRLSMNSIQQRIDWLQQGSRELFGTVIEDSVYIVIDTSSSMEPHIQFVKDKLYVLMMEQLKHKQKFNLVHFDTKAKSYMKKMVEVNEKNLDSAWSWIKELTCQGTTNTLDALHLALSDELTQAVYLLTDGRPNQPPQSLLAAIQFHRTIPIHTISFNCSDREANSLLYELSKETGGRFHYFSGNGEDLDGPRPWESEDIKILKEELKNGGKDLETVRNLRDECLDISRLSTLPDKTTSKMKANRPLSAPSIRTSKLNTQSIITNISKYNSKFQPVEQKKPSTANHTRTSLLRLMKDSNDWLLPESRALFTPNSTYESANDTNGNSLKTSKKKKKKKRLDKCSSKKWLAHHGLVPAKLTILDALGPTMIRHSPKYIPVLDKHVLSKVFDDILPIAHASGGNRKSVSIVNPTGVDLNGYILKLQAQVDKFNRRLNKITTNTLSAELKNEFNINVSDLFIKNKETFKPALDKSGSSTIHSDIKLIEKEINQAEIYINQAKELIKVAKNGGNMSDSEQIDDDTDTKSSPRSEVSKSESSDDEKIDDSKGLYPGLRAT